MSVQPVIRRFFCSVLNEPAKDDASLIAILQEILMTQMNWRCCKLTWFAIMPILVFWKNHKFVVTKNKRNRHSRWACTLTDVTPCSLAEVPWHFRATNCLHLCDQSSKKQEASRTLKSRMWKLFILMVRTSCSFWDHSQ